jgi:DNA-directed RNA polymerase beta' subunit
MKRYLTLEEINYILSDIHPIECIESTIRHNIWKTIVDQFRNELKQIQLVPQGIDRLKEKITKSYYRCQADAGDCVGITAAQSIGERQTQLALDSFHSTGITTLTVVAGVPRFNELINATKNPKSIISYIYTKENYYNVGDLREKVGIKLQQITFKHLLVKRQSIHHLPKWINAFYLLYPSYSFPAEATDCIFLFTLNTNLLYTFNITLQKVADEIMNHDSDIICAWSPDRIGELCVLGTPSLDVIIQGIKGIDQIHYSKQPMSKVWSIEAIGNNLKEILAHDSIDSTRSYSNYMWEIYNTLGIEATREFLIQEFINVISVDAYIHHRHVQLLVDVMLYTGNISSISRYGVHRSQASVLTTCSFEECLDQFTKAGFYGEKEMVKGVSGAIICGKMSHTGTGLCDLLYSLSQEDDSDSSGIVGNGGEEIV